MSTTTTDQVKAAGNVSISELLGLLREFHAAAEMNERPSVDVMARTSALLEQADGRGVQVSTSDAACSEELKLLKTLDTAVARRVNRFDGSCTIELDFRCSGMARLVESQLRALASKP